MHQLKLSNSRIGEKIYRQSTKQNYIIKWQLQDRSADKFLGGKKVVDKISVGKYIIDRSHRTKVPMGSETNSHITTVSP